MMGFGLRLAASLVAVAALAALAHAAPASSAAPALLLDRATPILPSRDPFYAVPDGLDDMAPGSILRHRSPPNPIAAFGLLRVDLAGSHQFLYRTTDSLGNATATVLTVLVPHHADPTKVLSYQVAEDAASVDCAPSYAFQLEHATGPGMGTLLTQAELLLVEAALEMGWIVIVPDALGPHGAFLANALAGHATLDGIRAAIRSAAMTGISAKPTVALWGYSGGSLASLWAAELQPSYAPELTIAGAAVGGTVPNITTVLGQVNGKGAAGLIPAGVLGLANQYPELQRLVDKHLRPQFRDAFLKARSQCFYAVASQFSGQDVVGMFDNRSLVYTDPLAVNIVAANNLGKATPTIPLFVYKAVADEVSPIAETEELVRRYCSAGATVELQRDLLGNHQELAVLAAPKALVWLKGVMDGDGRRRAGCTTRTVVSSLLDPAVVDILPKIVLDALLDMMGKPVGPWAV